MNKIKAGLIGFIGREGNPWDQLEQCARIGYKGLEGGDNIIRRGNEREDLHRLHDLGLEILTVGIMSSETLRKDGIEGAIERAHSLGTNRAVVYHGAAYFTKMNKAVTYDDIMRETEVLQKAAEACSKEGIKLAYHNHDPEFVMSFAGLRVFDMLLAFAPDLWVELDVGWVTYAGLDPVDVLHRVAPRLSVVHFKDYMKGDVYVPLWRSTEKYRMPNFCSLGSGELDVHGCLQACADIGIDWAVVEQDFMHVLNPMEALQVDYLVMKESGLIE